MTCSHGLEICFTGRSRETGQISQFWSSFQFANLHLEYFGMLLFQIFDMIVLRISSEPECFRISRQIFRLQDSARFAKLKRGWALFLDERWNWMYLVECPSLSSPHWKHNNSKKILARPIHLYTDDIDRDTKQQLINLSSLCLMLLVLMVWRFQFFFSLKSGLIVFSWIQAAELLLDSWQQCAGLNTSGITEKGNVWFDLVCPGDELTMNWFMFFFKFQYELSN